MANNRLKLLREEKGLSQREIAKKLHIPPTTYGGYENNKREPNSEMLITLADFFNCSIDYLLGRSDTPINDAFLDRVDEIDDDLLKQFGNLYEARKAQELRDKGLTIEQLFAETVSRKEIERKTCFASIKKYAYQFSRSVRGLGVYLGSCCHPYRKGDLLVRNHSGRCYAGYHHGSRCGRRSLHSAGYCREQFQREVQPFLL